MNLVLAAVFTFSIMALPVQAQYTCTSDEIINNIKQAKINNLKKLELMGNYPNSDYLLILYESMTLINKSEFINTYNEIIKRA